MIARDLAAILDFIDESTLTHSKTVDWEELEVLRIVATPKPVVDFCISFM